jgi:branched-chain amino acid transport system substrate-binding protein
MPALLTAWQDSTNAAGGINGHPVKVIVKDDALNPALSLQETKDLVTQDHVVAIIGDSSLVDSVDAPYLQSAGVPVVGGSTANAPFATNPDFFRSGTASTAAWAGIAAEIKQNGGKHLGVMYCAESPTCALANVGFKAISSLNGLSYSVEEISATAPNFTAQCLNFKNAGVDSVFIVDSYLVNVRVADDCAQIGYKPKWYTNTGAFGNNYLTDPNLNGTYVIDDNALYTDPNIPGVNTFLNAIEKYEPALKSSPQFTDNLTYVWAGAELFNAAAQAAKITPTSTAADVKKSLYSLKNETLDGLAPPLTFSSTAKIPAYPSCYFEYQILGGKYVSQNAGKAVCLSPAVVTSLNGLGLS